MDKNQMPNTGHPGEAKPIPPPATPNGWHTGPPDFVGVGAQRSGTTWWWSLLHRHPQIAHTGDISHLRSLTDRSEINDIYVAKEIHFFDHYEQVEEIDPQEYYQYFPRPEGKLAGEWSPHYLTLFWVPPMLHRVAPEAKILVMLRDPIDRFVSGVSNRRGWGAPSTSMLRLQEFDKSCYGRQLRMLTEYFDKSQMLILQYEKCRANLAAEMTKTLEFLGLEPELGALADHERPVGTRQPPALDLNADTVLAFASGIRT